MGNLHKVAFKVGNINIMINQWILWYFQIKSRCLGNQNFIYLIRYIHIYIYSYVHIYIYIYIYIHIHIYIYIDIFHIYIISSTSIPLYHLFKWMLHPPKKRSKRSPFQAPDWTGCQPNSRWNRWRDRTASAWSRGLHTSERRSHSRLAAKETSETGSIFGQKTW